jgi:glucose-6-phosphate isomerase
MFPKINPTNTQGWLLLKGIMMKKCNAHICENYLQQTLGVSNKFSTSFDDILFDYSKNIINNKTLQLLFQLAEECQVKDGIEAMFTGEKINETEKRSVLHVALRNFSGRPYNVDGENVMPDVEKVRDHMKAFTQKIHSGDWKGYTGKKIRYIVNIGIGGK